MLFNSFLFWAFFAIVWAIYLRSGHRRQNLLLLLASNVFYGAWDWRFLGLLWFSSGIDYFVARALGSENRQERRRALLGLSLVSNLGILGFFKYFNFFAAEFADFISMFGLTGHMPTLNIILPVGISFYTFQALSYTIDVYRRDLEPSKNFIDFALFITFFPQLVAGPIERATKLLPQIQKPRTVTREDLRLGVYDILYGLLLKVAIADNMAPIVNAVFGSNSYGGGDTLVAVYAFALQIYGDFAGYSFMARGIARWFGVDLMLNFRRPYFATSPSDFWQRWHISLSSWLRDYLYIPLGGNRKGKLLTYRNLMLTMVLGGLWHGAAWTFLVWGALHGILLIGFRLAGLEGTPRATAAVIPATGGRWLHAVTQSRVVRAVLFFHLICLTWVFFRASSMAEAWRVLTTIATDLTFSSFALGAISSIVFFAAPLIAYELWVERGGDHSRLVHAPWWARGVGYAYCAFMIIFFPALSAQQFIYFQF
jgi:D-alanyl-lipoteichoic acid acyltransferase DltB (MBOAT superfamily)